MEGTIVTRIPASRTPVEKSEIIEMFLRMAGGGLTIGLLIVLPALKILGIA